MKRPRIFYGWWIVAAGVGITWLSSTLFVYGFGAFFIAWREAFGWSRTMLGSLRGFSSVEGGVFGPFAGGLIDRYGPRRIMYVGIGLFGLGFVALSQVHSTTTLFLVYLGLLATGSSLGTMRPIQVALAHWFVRRRGRAMGLLMTGWGIGGSFVFLLGYLINAAGWRTAAFVSGLAIWAIGFPLAAIVRHTPGEMGLQPDGDAPPPNSVAANSYPHGHLGIDGNQESQLGSEDKPSAASPVAISTKPRAFWENDPRPEIDLTIWQALRTSAFWLLCLSHAVWAATPTISTIYLAPFLAEELKADSVVALSALSFFAFTSTFGRLVFGFLADYVNIRVLTALLLLAEGVGIFLFAQVQSMAQVPFYILIFAVAHGGIIPMQAVLTGYFFGKKQFGTIGGVISLVNLPANFAAPIWVGWMADTLPGGYRIGFKIIAATMSVAAVAILLARRPRPPLPEDSLPLIAHVFLRKKKPAIALDNDVGRTTPAKGGDE